MARASIKRTLGCRESVRMTEEERKHLVDMVTDRKAGLVERANQNKVRSSDVDGPKEAEGGRKDGMRQGCVLKVYVLGEGQAHSSRFQAAVPSHWCVFQ